MNRPPDDPIMGAYWVQPGTLLAGPYPGAWIPDVARNRVTRLLDAGITLFIDLTEPGETEPYADLLPATVEHTRFDIIDMDIPSERLMLRILDTIDLAIQREQKVYVHCLGGIGRTGTVIGCWLVRHGQTGQDALEQIVDLRGGLRDSPQTAAQFRFVRTWPEGGNGA